MRECHNLLEAAQSFDAAWGFIFDMDGLIFDTERLFMEQLAVVMAQRGYRLSREVYCRSLGLTGKALEKLMLTEYGTDYPFAELGRRAREHVDAIAATVGLELKPDIVTLLQWIRRQGLKAAVASSTRSDIVERYLEGAGIREYFSVIVGGEMVEKSKPEPDIFLKAAQLCGLKPEQAVVLEDSENGIRAAVAAGIPVICVPDLKIPEDEVCRMVNIMVTHSLPDGQ